jgi:hypothetical protein
MNIRYLRDIKSISLQIAAKGLDHRIIINIDRLEKINTKYHKRFKLFHGIKSKRSSS